MFEGQGKLVDYEAKLYIDEDVQSIYQPMYRYPYHLREKITKEINRESRWPPGLGSEYCCSA